MTHGKVRRLSSDTFTANWSNTEPGGGVHNSGSDITLTGCTFSRNVAPKGTDKGTWQRYRAELHTAMVQRLEPEPVRRREVQGGPGLIHSEYPALHQDVTVGAQVVEPHRVLGRAALAGHGEVAAPVLHPHERDPAQQPRARAPHGDHDDRPALDGGHRRVAGRVDGGQLARDPVAALRHEAVGSGGPEVGHGTQGGLGR